MKRNDFETFTEAFVELNLCFDKECKEERIVIYFNLLQEYPLKDILKAIIVAEKRCKFFPSVAELREILGDATDTLALQAWEKLRWAIKNYGADESVYFKDKGIHYAVEQMGGWVQFCETLLTKDVPFKQKDFERYYLYYLNHKDVDVLATSIPSYLVGNTEIGLKKSGHIEDIIPAIDIEERQKEQREKETRDNQRRFLQSTKHPAIKYKQKQIRGHLPPLKGGACKSFG